VAWGWYQTKACRIGQPILEEVTDPSRSDTESRLLRQAEERAVEVLKAHRDVLDKLVQLLVTNETVDGSQVYALAGRPEPSSGEA
jgi:cell division protease FtsH